jgi:hypothetical protein
MNRFGSRQNHENHTMYTKEPASWPLRGTAGKEFFLQGSHRSSAQRNPIIGGANHRT